MRRIKYPKRMNRRLHSLPFRKLQFYIEYKAKLTGLPAGYVDAKQTSSLCLIRGERLAPNGYRPLRRRGCGYENGRDATACLNLLKRSPGCGEHQLPRKPS